MSDVAAILMASGFSRRFGERNKLLVPFRGKALCRYTLELAAGMDFGGGIFFIAAQDEVAALASDFNTVRVLRNAAADKGRRESVRLGLEAAANSGAAHYLFFPCDQPFLDAGTVQRLLAARQHGCIVEPRYRRRPGNPCLFSAVFREELLALKEGETPSLIKARHPKSVIGVEVSSDLVLKDIDYEQDLAKVCL